MTDVRPAPDLGVGARRRSTRPAGGLTLLEVVVALVVLEVGVLGTLGILLLATRTTTRAELLEESVAVAEHVTDSLRVVASPVEGSRSAGRGRVAWTIDVDGSILVSVSQPLEGTSFVTGVDVLPGG